MRFSCWNRIQKSSEKCLEESAGCNFIMAFILLGMIVIDLYVCYHDELLLATSEDDQIAILVFVFAVVGYFLFVGVGDCFLEDNSRYHGNNFFGLELNVFCIKILHFFLVLVYSIHWLSMNPDDWNPVYYYAPMFFKNSLFCISAFIFFHMGQIGISIYVLYKIRNFSRIGAKMHFYGV